MNKLGIVGITVAVMLVVFAAGCAQSESEPAVESSGGENVIVTPSVVPLDSKSQVVIMGSGFQPGQSISILINDKFGNLSNMTNDLDPELVISEDGCWVSTWSLGRYASRGMMIEGVYSVRVQDESLAILASAPVAFVDAEKPRDQWPTWAQAAIPAEPI